MDVETFSVCFLTLLTILLELGCVNTPGDING